MDVLDSVGRGVFSRGRRNVKKIVHSEMNLSPLLSLESFKACTTFFVPWNTGETFIAEYLYNKSEW